MSQKELKIIESQIKKDPTNISLKLRYGKLLLKSNKIKESEKVYQSIIKQEPSNVQAKQGLVSVYFQKGNFSTVIVIAEDLAQNNQDNEKIKILHIKALLKQNAMEEAQTLYNKLISENPFIFDDELLDLFEDGAELDEEFENDHEQSFFGDDFDDDDDFDDEFFGDGSLFSNEHNTLEILENHILVREGFSNFQNVLGMDEVKKMMRFKFSFFSEDDEIQFLNHRYRRASMMMYGPTGAGKSHIMNAFVQEFYCPLIPVELSHSHLFPMIDKTRLLTLLIAQANLIKPVTLFIDHLEIFAPKQGDQIREETIMTLQSFENLNFNTDDVGMIAATNKPWAIDESIFRFGRIDDVVFVAPPNEIERGIFFQEHLIVVHNGLKKYKDELVELTKGFTVAELENVIDKSLYLNANGNEHFTPLKINSLRKAIKKIDPITPYWLEELKEKTKGNKRMENIFQDALNYTIV